MPASARSERGGVLAAPSGGPGEPVRRSEPRAGFTLVEVTLALALLSLVAALALPRMLPDGAGTGLRVKAYQLAALLRADRDAALRTGRVVSTDVDVGARRVRSGASGRSLVLPRAFAVRLTTGVPGGFRFFPNGTSTGGELVLVKGAAEVSTRVDGLTAAVTIGRSPSRDGG